LLKGKLSRTLMAERKTIKLPDFEPDKYQEAALNTTAKFLRVVAPAGAGKTQTLTAKAVQILSKEARPRNKRGCK
jgi:DNA helicase II / ATP-dependent DNA helicase PcrA